MIDWDAQPLGQMTDAELGRRLGCSRERVRQMRARRGIAKFAEPPIDWDAQPLGCEPDYVIAKRLGICSACVAKARNERGIARFDVFARYPELADRAQLHELYVVTEISPYEIAELLDVCVGTVVHCLRRHGFHIRNRRETLRAKGTREALSIAAKMRWVNTPAAERMSPPKGPRPSSSRYPLLYDRAWLEARRREGMSWQKIADLVGCSWSRAWHAKQLLNGHQRKGDGS